MYQITITDYYGKQIKIEVSEDIFNVYEESHKQERHEAYERRSHIDKRGLDNFYVLQELGSNTLPMEDQFCIREKLSQALAVLDSCTQVQRERFLLYTVYGYKCREIAAFHGCTASVVHKSIAKVREKIKKFQQEG